MGFQNFLSLLLVELLKVDWFKRVTVVQLGKFFSHSRLTTLLEVLHACFQRILGHDVVSDKSIGWVHVVVRVYKVCGCASSTFI